MPNYSIYEAECLAAGLDPKEVARVARGLARYAKQVNDMGLQVFGGDSSGTLRYRNERDKGKLICAEIYADFDGGSGAGTTDENGLLRGE